MTYYCEMDLHATNSVVAVIDDRDRLVFKRRLANELSMIVETLAPFGEAFSGLVVESTYNWYWLVDGLMDAGFRVHLANPAAIHQYSGLKHSDDEDDAAQPVGAPKDGQPSLHPEPGGAGDGGVDRRQSGEQAEGARDRQLCGG